MVSTESPGDDKLLPDMDACAPPVTLTVDEPNGVELAAIAPTPTGWHFGL